MATVPEPSFADSPEDVRPAAGGAGAADRLKQVPADRADRERIRRRAVEAAATLDVSRPFGKEAIEAASRAVLDELGFPDAFLGWTMVLLASAFWRRQVITVPYHRRLLLLPHCLRNAERCPAEYNALGLWCQDCGACHLSDLRACARQMGYQVLIAEGSPVVMELILAGKADAILGVACLNALEKSLDKILLAGIPCMAVPLWASTCRNTATDEDWVREMIATPYRPGTFSTRTYLHLLRGAAGMFEAEELYRLAPRQRGGPTLAEADGQGLAGLDPLAVTEAVAYDFLLTGGKHYRPFITLAAYDVMTGGHASGPHGAECVARLPDAVKRVALAIEVFHKASLVHDDVEDDDPFRYGRATLHRAFGAPLAINVGDYLIGLGYRMVAAQKDALSSDAVADLLALFSHAHTRLCEGQGAELAWRDARDKRLSPLDALTIYALKTAPAFEAALWAGLRLAGPAELYREPCARFARHLGVAFQILNDLEDWQPQPANKRSSGGDASGGRPTVLWALALEGLVAAGRRELERLASAGSCEGAALSGVRDLYLQADVFRKASELLSKHRRRALAAADQVAPDDLRRLLHYFLDTMVPGKKDEG